MGRIIAAVMIVAAIGGGIFYYHGQKQNAIHIDDEKRIADLQQQTSALQNENEQLKAELARVQAEQANLAAQNDALNRAIAQYKATGKMPDVKLPYPPK